MTRLLHRPEHRPLPALRVHLEADHVGVPRVAHPPADPHPHQRQGAQAKEQAVRDGRVLTKALFFILCLYYRAIYISLCVYIYYYITYILYHVYYHIIYY